MFICSLRGDVSPRVMREQGSDYYPVGVEIEYENCTDFYASPFWATTGDGSLRDMGMEYIFRNPSWSQEDTEERIRGLTEFARHNRYRTSVRTGVHVHVNMQDIRMDKLSDILLAYALAEPMLFAFAGNERTHNPYCIPWAYAPEDMRRVLGVTYMAGTPTTRNFAIRAHRTLGNTNKYSALYAAHLGGHGTIEFRHLPTTLDAQRLCDWVTLIQKVVRFGETSDVQGLVLGSDHLSAAEFMLRSIGEWDNYAAYYSGNAAVLDIEELINEAIPWISPPPSLDSWVPVLTDRHFEEAPPREDEVFNPRRLEEILRNTRVGNRTHARVGTNAEFEWAEPEEDLYITIDEEAS